MRRLAACLGYAFICGITLTGCKSISSSALNRRSDDLLIRDLRPTPGVPVRIKVPSHLQVHITETVLLQNQGGGAKPDWKPIQLPQPMLNIATNLRYTDKIFTVDFKRPAAGLGKYYAKFGDDQYFSEIRHEVEDRTIRETSAAVETLMGALMPSGSAAGFRSISSNDPKTLLPGERTVAWAEFDINDCDFEEQVRAFVSQYLNEAITPLPVASVEDPAIDPHDSNLGASS